MKNEIPARILVIEDDAFIADDIASCLVELGYTVVGPFASAELAQRSMEESRPDLLLSDIRLQGKMDGIELGQYARSRYNIPVVYLTAHADDATLERAQVTEPYGYVLKPFSEIELRTALKLALARHFQSTLQSHFQEDSQTVHPSPSEVSSFRDVPLLSNLSGQQIGLLLQGSRVERCKAGQILISEGAQEADGLFVKKGRLTFFKGSSSGKEFIVEFLSPSDVFGIAVALAWDPYPVSVRAQVDSEVIWISRAFIAELAAQDSIFAKKIISDIFERLRVSHDVSRGLAHDRAEARVASAILDLAKNSPYGKRDGGSFREVRITRHELAERTGCATETVIRITRALEENSVLDLSRRGRISILDCDALSALATSE
ncbi:MAG: response regulator [Bdellovibrionales bacterium]|nr:response regulator [Bdellovibrionales bacterium]